MKKNFLTSVALLSLLACSAQTFQSAFTFGGTGSESGNAVVHDDDGNLITGGSFMYTSDFDPGAGTMNLTEAGNSGNSDAFIASYTQSGTLNWAFALGNTNGEMITALDVDTSGNIYATGIFTNTVDFDPGAGVTNVSSSGGYDWFVAKYNSSGALLWATAFPGAGNDMPRCIRIYQGGVYVGGYVDMSNIRTPYLAVWDKATGTLGFAGACFASDHGQIEKIEFTTWGDMFVCGFFRGTTNFDLYTGTVNRTSNGGDDAFVAKYTTFPSYALQSVLTFGGTGSDQASGLALKNFDCYVSGTFTGTIDADPNAGTTNLSGNGLSNVFISRFNSSGGLVYAKALSTSGVNDLVIPSGGITFDPAATKLVLTGYYQGTVDIDPSATTNALTSNGNNPDALIALYDYNTGALVSHRTIEGSNTSQTFSGVTVFPSGDIYGIGNFNGNFTNFDPGYTNVMLNGTNDVFLTHYMQCVTTTTHIYDSICQGDVYNFGSQQLTTSGWFYDTLASIHNCDSALVLHLYVASVYAPQPTVNGDTLYSGNSGYFQWIDCTTGLPIAGATNSTYVATLSGDYAYILSWASCSDTSACTTITLNSVHESDNGISSVLFPNPAADHFTILFDQQVNTAVITIRDITGNTVLMRSMTAAQQTEINFDAAPGIYLVTVATENSTVVHRLVKE